MRIFAEPSPGPARPLGPDRVRPRLEMWGGLECTVNRVGDRYFDQLVRNGHCDRAGDVESFAALGIQAIRYPLLWERVAPLGLAAADWTWADERMQRLRRSGMRLILGLVHHGSGPPTPTCSMRPSRRSWPRSRERWPSVIRG